MEPAARMRELVDRLNETAQAYYTQGNSPISDMQWDAMYDELAALEKSTGITVSAIAPAQCRTTSASVSDGQIF